MRLSRFYVGLAIAALATAVTGAQEMSLHRIFQLGASLSQLRPLMEKDCSIIDEQHYTGKMAAPYEDQVQLNCDGLEVLGSRRKVEFMFDDGPLGHLWVLIGIAERAELLPVLEKTFGPVVYESNGYKVFASGTAALRNEPTELLIARKPIVTRLTGYPGSVWMIRNSDVQTITLAL